MQKALDTELEYFESIKDELLKYNRGKFAVIQGQELAGIWDSGESAYLKGVERFGLKSFLVRRIEEEEEVVDLPTLFFEQG